MTANEIIARAEELVEESYATATWLAWIRAVLEDLTPLAKIFKETEVTLTIASNEATVNLAAITDFFELVNVSIKPTGKRRMKLRKLPAYDGASQGWVRYDTTVKLQNLTVTAGKAVVEYYAKLALTASGTDYTLNLPADYHDIVVKGVCALAMQKEEEFDRKQDFYGEYTLGKRRIYAERLVAMEPWNASAMRGGGAQ